LFETILIVWNLLEIQADNAPPQIRNLACLCPPRKIIDLCKCSNKVINPLPLQSDSTWRFTPLGQLLQLRIWTPVYFSLRSFSVFGLPNLACQNSLWNFEPSFYLDVILHFICAKILKKAYLHIENSLFTLNVNKISIFWELGIIFSTG